jgi:ABC-type Mn2+/Zn2+ transport system permease subunit
MTSNVKLKLVGLFTTVALFALPAAAALAVKSWY